MNFSLAFSNVAVITSLSLLIDFGLSTGGPVIMLYGWLIVSFFSLLIGSAMAEICSTYPAAGSVYFWSGVLANKSWAPIASYYCGWFNFLGNISNTAGFGFGLA